MTTIKHILRSIDTLQDERMREICVAIVSAVAEHADPKQKKPLWTTGLIADWVGVEVGDPDFLRSLQLLAGWREAQLLDVHYLYFDSAGLCPDGVQVSDDAVRSAYQHGTFEDPDSGDLISDFECLLEPYFVPAPSLELQK